MFTEHDFPAEKELQSFCDALFEAIKHGDDKHQEWLKTAINDFYMKWTCE